MSDMPGNPHYAEADIGRDYFEDADNQRLTQATLALAYERRTANLIAAANMVGTDLTGLPDKSMLHWVDLAQAINTRLGLKD